MSTSPTTDLPGLCARIGHDPDALEAVYREHVRDVERFVSRRVRDPFDVADPTADVFVRAIGSAPPGCGCHRARLRLRRDPHALVEAR